MPKTMKDLMDERENAVGSLTATFTPTKMGTEVMVKAHMLKSKQMFDLIALLVDKLAENTNTHPAQVLKDIGIDMMLNGMDREDGERE